MNSDIMNQDLVDELEYMEELLTKSGFFDSEEILEILEDQFIDEDIDISQYSVSSNDFSNENFSKLENAFTNLASEKIVAIHNCGYDISEGVNDAFELYVHLHNNKFSVEGFCFYTFEDIEESICECKLKITFGDFENNEEMALKIGKIVFKYLKEENFNIAWDGTINNQIEIYPFKWDKSYDSEKEYEIEGAYEVFIKNQVLK
ncbi:hypothetical protein SAMN05216439_1860 [Methanobrevibacter gottschalkii]|uniref:DUF6891 domain-containing protein n=2 Tax=Methanobrevibacter gottschalkii TaxID=190974 RepID=A0A1H7M105_9EURY|nr:hypothetical protein [archaeon]SEL04277.1 hypothetical protein SAMN05216439_1860 [Methanobrevibacter gottschalkii]